MHLPTLDDIPGYISRKNKSSFIILYNISKENLSSGCISYCLSFSVRLINSLSFLFASTKKNKLNISKFYRDSITFQINIMHISINFDQTDRIRTARYDDAEPDKYLSDSDSYNDESDLRSDDYNNYESNYESDNEETSYASTSTIKTPLVQPLNVKEQKINVTYTLRQEKFNDNFSLKDLLNAIREIFLSPPRDMSDEKGSLEYLPIYLFLFSNEKGSSLYNAYDRDEVKDKLVIKIDQDNRASKFSVADNISEVYDLPG